MTLRVLALATILALGAFAQDYHRVVFVMRHCVRSTTVTFTDEPYPSYNNYSALPFPNWPVEEMLCLPRGLEIIEGQGVNLQGQFPLPLRIISDAIQRDINTSISLLAGLGYSGVDIEIDGSIFDPVSAGICPAPTEEFMNAALQYRWNEWPIPSNHTELMAEMQALLGQGIAPAIQNIDDSVFDSNFNGGSYVASQFAEFIEMAYGGGLLNTTWTNTTDYQMYVFTQFLSYARAVAARALPIVQYTESNLLAHVLAELDDETNSTTIFVGHDTDLDALATFFNIQWITPDSYATNHTSPGAMLRFDLYSSQQYQQPTIFATFLTTTYENTNGNLTISNATFLDGTNYMLYSDFHDIATNLLYMPCVNVTSASH